MRAGLMLVSGDCPEVLELTVPALMLRVDVGVLSLNNMSEATLVKCREMCDLFPNSLALQVSGIEHPPYDGRRTRLHWWRKTRDRLRSEAWSAMREVCMSGFGRTPDTVLWPDADEMPAAGFDAALERFEASEGMRAMALKPVDVFDDMSVAKGWSMAPHCRAYRYGDDIDPSARGLRKAGRFTPILPEEVMTFRHVTVHLPYLFPEVRERRYAEWKRPDFSDRGRMRDRRPFAGLWRLPKPAPECSAREISRALAAEPFSYVDDYLRERGLEA